jgi:hypothetical protein
MASWSLYGVEPSILDAMNIHKIKLLLFSGPVRGRAGRNWQMLRKYVFIDLVLCYLPCDEINRSATVTGDGAQKQLRLCGTNVQTIK